MIPWDVLRRQRAAIAELIDEASDEVLLLWAKVWTDLRAQVEAEVERRGQARMRGMEEREHRLGVAVGTQPPTLTDGIEKPQADARALPLRHDDQAACPSLPKPGQRRHAHVGDELTADRGHVARRRDHPWQL